MNESILNLVKQYAGNAIVNNPEVPNSKNDVAIQSVSEGILNGLKNQASGGGLGQILNMFKTSGNVSSTLTQNVENSVVTSLMNKVGIQNTTAKSIATSIVPMVLNGISKLGKNSTGNGNGMNVQSILNSLTDGKTSGMDIQSILKNNFGGDDGKFDLNDVMNMVGKGSGNSSSGEGNLINEIGHLFGKK